MVGKKYEPIENFVDLVKYNYPLCLESMLELSENMN